MPGEHERHSRPNGCCEGWESQPSRSQQRAAVIDAERNPEVVPQGKRPPGKKDPDLCKAAHWKGPHRPELRLQQYGWLAKRECKWDVSWRNPDGPAWYCCHDEVCAGCGKILRGSIPRAECPDFHPVTPEERPALVAEAARVRELRAARAARRPVIDGPQGYRRKRSA